MAAKSRLNLTNRELLTRSRRTWPSARPLGGGRRDAATHKFCVDVVIVSVGFLFGWFVVAPAIDLVVGLLIQ